MMPEASQSLLALLASAMLLASAGSVHCIGMCGGIGVRDLRLIHISLSRTERWEHFSHLLLFLT